MTKRPLLLAFLLAAFLILMLGERGLPASRQPELSDGETVTLTGIVEEIAEKENSRQIRLSHIYLSSDLSYQRQVLVYENQQTTLKIGYKVKAAGSYAPLEEASNPGQFDQKAYYEARGIGMVLKKAKLTVIEAKENIFFQKLYELRSFWAQNLEKITGCIEEKYLDTDSRIYIRLNHDKIYEAFPMDVSTEDGKTDSSGFCLYLDCSLLAADGNQIEILTGNKDSARIIGGLTL